LTTAVKRTSRAIERLIQPGALGYCEHCQKGVTFRARKKLTAVIVNCYWRGAWQRVEHYHSDCYEAAGQPYGEPDRTQIVPMTASQKRAKAYNVEDD